MTNWKAPARATTAPKGRPTPKRDADKRLRDHQHANWRLEWAVVAIVIVAVVVALVMFGPGGSGAPTHVPIGGHGG